METDSLDSFLLRKLYAEIARMNGVHAGKITGMMLELLACTLATCIACCLTAAAQTLDSEACPPTDTFDCAIGKMSDSCWHRRSRRMDNSDILAFLESPERLQSKVSEALDMLTR